MKAFRLHLFFCLLLASCASDKPQPQIQFVDRPSSLAPSAYRPDADTTVRQNIAGGDRFLAESEDALNRGIGSLNAANEAKRQARAKRDAEWRAAGSPIDCPHCSGGRTTYEYKGIFGWTALGDKPCIYCHGTGYVKSVQP